MLASLAIRPGRAEVEAAAAKFPLVPIWAELPLDGLQPLSVFRGLAGEGPGVLLEELDLSGSSIGYTIVAGDPAALVRADGGGVRIESVRRPLPVAEGLFGPPETDLRTSLNRLAAALRAPQVPELPTMTGGLAGLLNYEAAALFGGLAYPIGRGRVPAPPVTLMVMDRVAVFDHRRGRLVLVAHIPAGTDYQTGESALAEMAARIEASAETVGDLPQPVRQTLAVAPNTTTEMFRSSIRRVQEEVATGEVSQVVLSRRLATPARESGLEIYRRLRQLNPSPAMFYLRIPGLELAGSSPEPLLKVQGRRVSTRPITGIWPRSDDEQEDRQREQALGTDPGELAGHAVLVELARHDLEKVCAPGTVAALEPVKVARFSRVLQLVSSLGGELAPERTALDALAAVFPAGAVTGAPKHRAMEIIAREEPTARGPYAGACGYLTFSGDLEFCITIRTAVVSGGQVHVQAGAGVVGDSDPAQVLAATEAEASALLAAIGGAGSSR
jgi:anthranilate synthase component 1